MKRIADKVFAMGGLSLPLTIAAERIPAAGIFVTLQGYMRDIGVTPNQTVTFMLLAGFATMCYGAYLSEGQQIVDAKKPLPTPPNY